MSSFGHVEGPVVFLSLAVWFGASLENCSRSVYGGVWLPVPHGPDRQSRFFALTACRSPVVAYRLRTQDAFRPIVRRWQAESS
jgi:hypothetical protein